MMVLACVQELQDAVVFVSIMDDRPGHSLILVRQDKGQGMSNPGLIMVLSV